MVTSDFVLRTIGSPHSTAMISGQSLFEICSAGCACSTWVLWHPNGQSGGTEWLCTRSHVQVRLFANQGTKDGVSIRRRVASADCCAWLA
ncbi:MAG TPA: hypothetical protein VIV60_35120 [Polyangiaceae bacterium]